MSDIVERLRKHVNNRGGPSIANGAWEMMLEAANEIDRLRAAIRVNGLRWGHSDAEIEAVIKTP